MKKLLISVKDLKADFWSVPSAADNIPTACRMFGDLVRDGRSLVGQHPEDFELYVVGEFDISSGDLESSAARRIAVGSDFVKEGA